MSMLKSVVWGREGKNVSDVSEPVAVTMLNTHIHIVNTPGLKFGDAIDSFKSFSPEASKKVSSSIHIHGTS